MENKLEYVIIQAGGKGTRLGYLTRNKPKILISINSKPLISYYFEAFLNSNFIIIVDYKKEVLEKYLKIFAKVKYKIIETTEKGTCAGINEALKIIPAGKAFAITWCDLLFHDIVVPNLVKSNLIGLSNKFECRWSYKNNKLLENKTRKNGVAGFFVFYEKKILNNIPASGEFVKWLSFSKIRFKKFILKECYDVGNLSNYLTITYDRPKNRPFNKLTFIGNKVIKSPVNNFGKGISNDEINWYKEMQNSKFKNIPEIYSFSPLTMKKICGHNIFEFQNVNLDIKKEILKKLVNCLTNLHSIRSRIKANAEDCEKVYITKTLERVSKVKDLIPFLNKEKIIVNGIECVNPIKKIKKFREILFEIFPKFFCPIHGDCTFHNILLSKSGDPVLIDPRGYFGSSKIYGDEDYDWAKMYYSLAGNYDQFNKGFFELTISKEIVSLKIESNQWESLENDFFDLTKSNKDKIKILHGIIWLSLSSYFSDNYDAICAAFYNGVLKLNEYLE